MKNLALAKKLEGCFVNMPSDYRGKVLSLDFSPDVRDYADAVVHNLEEMDSTSGHSLNAMHMVAACFATIAKMMKASYSRRQVLATYNITPEYLAIMIPDEYVRHDAITLFNEEITELIGKYANR